MKRILGIVSVGLCAGLPTQAAERGLFLGNATKPANTIVYDASDSIARGAAQELGEYLGRVFELEFSIEKAGADQEGDIYVGKGIVPAGLLETPTAEDAEWLAAVVTEEGKLYLWGNDLPKSQGTYWAAEAFLRDHCGVRWLWPGELGQVVPKLKTLRVSAGTILDSPEFVIREPSFGYSGYISNEERVERSAWYRRMRFGRSLQGFKGTSGFNHFFRHYIPNSEFEKHPEYFGLVYPRNWIGSDKPEGPERRIGQLCTSNPDVRRIIAEKIIATDTPDIMPISPEDGFLFCECDNCKAQDSEQWEDIYARPDLSDRIFDFVRDIATQVKAGNPKSKIGIFSYSFFSNPPKDLTPMPDNVYISMTYSCGEMVTEAMQNDFRRRLEGFNKLGVKFVGREYWGTHYYCNLPWLHTVAIDENVKQIRANGAIGLYGEGGKDFANNALNYYLLSTLMWNPDASREEIIDDFCQSAFGEGAAKMKEYFQMLEDAGQSWVRSIHEERTDGGVSYATRLNGFRDMYNPQVLQKGRQLLAAAAKAAKDDLEKRRVLFFREGLDYTQIFVNMIDKYQAAAGVGAPLVFVHPRAPEGPMDDKMITDILSAAVAASAQRERRLSALQGESALDLGLLLSADKTELRPWYRLNQDALWQIRKGAYNYLVNGAFEFRDFAWRLDSEKVMFDLSYNHDSIHNSMANFHARQGCSLKTTLAGGQGTEVENTITVRTKPGVKWLLAGAVRDPDSIGFQPKMVGTVDGKPFERALTQLPNGVTDSLGWREFLCDPLTIPDGEDIVIGIKISFENKGDAEAAIWLDDLRLSKLP